METLKYEEIKGLREHQPIPFGFWKMLFGTVVTLVLLANCVWFGFSIVKQLTGKVPGDLNAGIGAFFMVVTMGGIGFYVVTGARREWLVQYWRRNVVGYVARSVLVDKPVSDALGEWPRLQQDIRTRKEDADDRWQTHRVHAPLGESNVAISLPLGGWFAQSWIRGIDRDEIGRLQGWSVKLRAIFDTGAVMVEVRCQNRRWGVNERIVTDIGSALRHLEYVATDTMHALNGSWSDIIAHLLNAKDVAASEGMAFNRHKRTLFEILHDIKAGSAVTDVEWIEEQVRRLIAERDAAKKESGDSLDLLHKVFLILRQVLGETAPTPEGWKDHAVEFVQRFGVEYGDARRKRNESIGFVDNLVREFGQSGRLLNTVDGTLLLYRMLNWLCGAVVQDSPEYRMYHDRFVIVSAMYAEKVRRDRRRHGKKVDPASAPAA